MAFQHLAGYLTPAAFVTEVASKAVGVAIVWYLLRLRVKHRTFTGGLNTFRTASGMGAVANARVASSDHSPDSRRFARPRPWRVPGVKYRTRN